MDPAVQAKIVVKIHKGNQSRASPLLAKKPEVV
jgi:hypothetical protein